MVAAFKALACFLIAGLFGFLIIHQLERDIRLSLRGVEATGRVIESDTRRCGKKRRRTCYNIEVTSVVGRVSPHVDFYIPVGETVVFTYDRYDVSSNRIGRRQSLTDVAGEWLGTSEAFIFLPFAVFACMGIGWTRDAISGAAPAARASSPSQARSRRPEDGLSSAELQSVHSQILRCTLLPDDGGSWPSVELWLTVNPDRSVDKTWVVGGKKAETDPRYKIAAQAVLRALRHPACHHLDLPEGDYHRWKAFSITVNLALD